MKNYTEKITAPAAKNLNQWLSEEKYKEYKAELEKMIETEQWSALNDAFFTVIPFGTGGRRGTVGVGSNRINKITIGESAQGFAEYLLKNDATAAQAGIVIAHDTRLTSPEFAEYTASIFAANGIKTYLFDSFRATPELSFAVRHLKAAAGVVISASHNPPPDNGFKAYWSDGGQIVSPHDKSIMDEVATVITIKTTNFADAVAQGKISIINEEVDAAYIQALLKESLVSSRSAQIVYSPLHGTGISSVKKVLEAAGFNNLFIVPEQAMPDGHFPNIPNNIPNPEVLSASDMVTKYAKEQGADIGITTDPDADRLGVVARDKNGTYQFLTGNQIAALIGFFVLEQMHKQEKLTSQHYIAKTIVTTDLLDAIAADFKVKNYNKLLVGFKYIAELINTKPDETFIFGGEESHGILKGTYTRDKDAAIAALLIAELVSYLKDQGKTLLDQLEELYKKYGVYWERLVSVTYPGADGFATMQRIMKELRTNPPKKVGSFEVISFVDRLVSNEGAKGDVLVFNLSSDNHTRVTVRPSGTEPKLKLYTQVFHPDSKEKAITIAQELEQAFSEYCKTI